MTKANLKNLIFNKLIDLYIKKANPIGSRILERKYFRNLAESTIRLYLNRLTEEEYLITVKKSVGRIPTDKGWKYYLEVNKDNVDWGKERGLPNYSDNRLFDYIADKFNLYYIIEKDSKLIEGGLEYTLRNLEFENKGIVLKFARFLREVKESFLNNLLLKDNEIKILIGEEIDLKNAEHFSVIACRKGLSKLIFINVKRMNYPLIYSIVRDIIKERL
jgi:transcriptional regulator of heat shock response